MPKCPNCGHYTLQSESSRLRTAALAALIASGLFLVFLITIPLVPITLILAAVLFARSKGAEGYTCRYCKLKTI